MPNPERLLVAFRCAREGSVVSDPDLGAKFLALVTQARASAALLD